MSTSIEVRRDSDQVPPGGGRPRRYLSRLRSQIASDGSIWLVSASTFINGLLSVFLILFTHFPVNARFFGLVAPFGLYHLSSSLTVALGFLLIYLSFNLYQRRLIAWWLAITGSGIAIFIHISQSQLWPLAVSPIITFTLLLVFRKRFTVRSERSRINRGLMLMSLSLAIAIIYGVVGFLLLHQRDFSVNFSFSDALVPDLRELVLIGNSDLVPATSYASWFLTSIRLIGIVAYVFAFYSLFRPIAYRYAALPYEKSTAQSILDQFGRGSYDYFKVWPDKSYFFSPARQTFISYRVEWNIAVCLGDPVGPDNEIKSTLRSFIDYCNRNGWGVAFMFPERLTLYPGSGLHLLKIGEEGIVDLEHFVSQTWKRKYFRHIRNKFSGLGYKFVRYLPPQPTQLLDEVQKISQEWLLLPEHREFGFAQGTFERNYIRNTPISVLRDETGLAVAFVNEVTSYRPGEINFDMMRHLPGMPNGTMDYVFMNLMLALKEEGYRTFAMGVAPFTGLGQGPRASVVEKAVHQLRHLDRFVHSQGIYKYKLKFEPFWEDRYIAYKGGPLSLVKIALAINKVVEG